MTEPKADTKQLTPQEEPEMRKTIFDALKGKEIKTTVIDIGNKVICDWCGEDWTLRPGSGGILFGSKACCPSCAPGVEVKAKFFNEEDHINGRCPRGINFYTWVIKMRNGDNTIKVTTWDNSNPDKRCDMCGKPATEFKDELSAKEYEISGMCQKCQDGYFK